MTDESLAGKGKIHPWTQEEDWLIVDQEDRFIPGMEKVTVVAGQEGNKFIPG